MSERERVVKDYDESSDGSIISSSSYRSFRDNGSERSTVSALIPNTAGILGNHGRLAVPRRAPQRSFL